MVIFIQRNGLKIFYAVPATRAVIDCRWLAVLTILFLTIHATQALAQEKWCATYNCPNCAAHGAGPNTQTACYSSRGECENMLRQNFSGHYYGSVSACTSSAGASGAGNADSSIDGLVKQSSQAVAKGIVYGNSQLVGMGLAGMGVALLLGGDNIDPQQAALAEQQRQAEMQQQQEQSRLAQEAVMRQQELARQRIMHDLKDSTDTDSGLQFKDAGSAGLQVAEVSSSLGTRALVPVNFGTPVTLDDSGNNKLASNSGFDTAGQLLGSNAALPDIPTPESAPVLTRKEKIQQALLQDPDYAALTRKQEQDQKTVDDAQKKLDELQLQKQIDNSAARQADLDRQIAIQSQHLSIAQQDLANIESRQKAIETRIEGSVEIVD
jgi:hypothetical protein